MAKKVEGRIVEAVGAASNTTDGLTAEQIQTAMSEAAAEAQAEGLSDHEVRDRMLAARKQLKANARSA